MKTGTGLGVGAAAAFLTVILVWAAKQFTQIEVPDYVAQAFTGLVTFVAGYFTGTVPEVTKEHTHERKQRTETDHS